MYFLFLVSSKLTLVPNASCICNCKPFCSHLCDYLSFLLSDMKVIIFKVAKMVDLDKSCKHMGWNGQDSL
jgi:hypothetical protein